MADKNPGNFANRPKEEVQEIASKGGQASHSGGFASMDPDKQVIYTPLKSCSSQQYVTVC
jgi:general stress protein YciG